MNLQDYLTQQGITPSEFAKRIGVSQPTVSRYLRGVRFPRLKHLVAIERETGGAVRASDFLPREDRQ